MGALLCSLGAATWAYLPPAAPPRRAGFSDSARPLRRWNSASLSPRASPRNSPPLKPRGENISLSPPPWTRKKPCAGTSRQTVNCEDSPPALHQAVAGGQRRRPARSAPWFCPAAGDAETSSFAAHMCLLQVLDAAMLFRLSGRGNRTAVPFSSSQPPVFVDCLLWPHRSSPSPLEWAVESLVREGMGTQQLATV